MLKKKNLQNLLKLALVAVTIEACQSFKNEPHEPTTDFRQEIIARKKLYCEISKEKFETIGSSTRCDGLLFHSLHAIACGFPDIKKYQGEPGQWFRSQTHDCFIPPDKDNGAKSTISKDMYAGLLLYIAHKKDGELAKVTYEYCKKNMIGAGIGCQVGKGINAEVELSRTVLPPTTIQILEDMKEKYLNGRNVSHGTSLPQKKGLKDYQAHLQVLRILLHAKVYGGITDGGVDILKDHCSRNPDNVLFCAAYQLFINGDMNEVSKKLVYKFPPDRLPESTDWCTHYLWQREQSNDHDWKPCPDMSKIDVWDGTDFLIAASLILGEL